MLLRPPQVAHACCVLRGWSRLLVCNAAQVKAWPLALGTGIRASKVMTGIAELAGLTDVGIKVRAALSPCFAPCYLPVWRMHVLHCLLEALCACPALCQDLVLRSPAVLHGLLSCMAPWGAPQARPSEHNLDCDLGLFA